MSNLLLLTTIFLFVIGIIRDIDPYTKLVTKLVDSRSVGTNDTTDVFSVNIKLS